jgi:hypothetical protein
MSAKARLQKEGNRIPAQEDVALSLEVGVMALNASSAALTERRSSTGRHYKFFFLAE